MVKKQKILCCLTCLDLECNTRYLLPVLRQRRRLDAKVKSLDVLCVRLIVGFNIYVQRAPFGAVCFLFTFVNALAISTV